MPVNSPSSTSMVSRCGVFFPADFFSDFLTDDVLSVSRGVLLVSWGVLMVSRGVLWSGVTGTVCN